MNGAAHGPDTVYLCATHRLARRLAEGEGPVEAAGLRRRAAAYTIAQWLALRQEEQALRGLRHGAPRRLDSLQERMLWRRVIDDALREESLGSLLDREGLIDAAVEANALIERWQVRSDAGWSEDARQFAAWRAEFRRRCQHAGWIDSARADAAAIAALGDAPPLPARVVFAGFDRLDPLAARLRAALAERGVEVGSDVDAGLPAAAPPATVLAFDDADFELAAAVAWAQAALAADPAARLAIVVPDLAERRDALLRRLDEAFAPECFRAALADAARPYNLSLGDALADAPGIDAALALLRLAVRGEAEQAEFGALLCGPWWGADVAEASARARLDADLRRHLPPTVGLAAIVRRAYRRHYRHGGLEASARALAELARHGERWTGRRPPSAWAEAFGAALDAAGWPGERPASSREFQAQEAFAGAFEALAELDPFAGRVAAGEALSLLGEACRGTIFQPRTEGRPRLQVLGLLEAATERFDAIWVCALDETRWPPAPRPNPFLHPAAQRAAGSPNASAEVQLRFAAAIHRRLLRVASSVRLSWTRREDEREQLPSPLLGQVDEEMAVAAAQACLLPLPLAERLAAAVAAPALERLDDAQAPPVAAGETVRGGTQLLRAQAACPAWAYYQYRLGARRLEAPIDGLDGAARGTLAHRALEHFWRGRDADTVFGWDAPTRALQIATAVEAGIAAFEAEADEALSPRLRQLEAARLAVLLDRWLELEVTRPRPFAVEGCEVERQLTLRGLPIRVVADRIDRLADGRLAIIDYKTGKAPAPGAWSGERIGEPQLPVYAAFAADGGEVAALAFACLRERPPKFAGLAAAAGLLPGVGEVGVARGFDATAFPDWAGALATWRERLLRLADEIHEGHAAVSFDDERALEWAEVLPLLRLAERRWLLGGGEGEDGWGG